MHSKPLFYSYGMLPREVLVVQNVWMKMHLVLLEWLIVITYHFSFLCFLMDAVLSAIGPLSKSVVDSSSELVL
jgi:hypothetical protein